MFEWLLILGILNSVQHIAMINIVSYYDQFPERRVQGIKPKMEGKREETREKSGRRGNGAAARTPGKGAEPGTGGGV